MKDSVFYIILGTCVAVFFTVLVWQLSNMSQDNMHKLRDMSIQINQSKALSIKEAMQYARSI